MPASRQYLLVDGYNVAHCWPDVSPVIARDIDAAAAILVERLTPLHDPDQCEVTIVFDGRGSVAETVREAPSLPCVIYSPSGTSADAIIEQIVARAPDPNAFTVVSRDNALCLSVYAGGANVISPDDLLERLHRESSDAARRIAGNNQTGSHHFGSHPFDGL